MQVAQILSDLTSLRVCDHQDALALVTVNEDTQSKKDTQTDSTPDNDLRRAKELVDLHYAIKARHADGKVDAELARAREDVDQVLQELEEEAW